MTIVRSDKGGELVVMNTTQLHGLTTDHLSDETTYKQLPKNPTEAMRVEINQTLKNILNKTLLELGLKNNIIRYENQMYQQALGLAIGGRVSGTLAILVMDRFEPNYIYNQLAPTSTIYVRYIDDTNNVANNADEAVQMLEYLNSKTQHY